MAEAPVEARYCVHKGWGYVVEIRRGKRVIWRYSGGNSPLCSQTYGVRNGIDEETLGRYARATLEHGLEEFGLEAEPRPARLQKRAWGMTSKDPWDLNWTRNEIWKRATHVRVEASDGTVLFYQYDGSRWLHVTEAEWKRTRPSDLDSDVSLPTKGVR